MLRLLINEGDIAMKWHDNKKIILLTGIVLALFSIWLTSTLYTWGYEENIDTAYEYPWSYRM